MAKKKYDWKYSENKNEMRYDVTVDGKHLSVIGWRTCPPFWRGFIDDYSIDDKTANDYERKRHGLPLGCPVNLLPSVSVLSSDDPEYMKKKVERCFRANKTEICR